MRTSVDPTGPSTTAAFARHPDTIPAWVHIGPTATPFAMPTFMGTRTGMGVAEAELGGAL